MCNIFILSRYIDYLLYIYIYICDEFSLSLSLVSIIEIIIINYYEEKRERRKKHHERKQSRKKRISREEDTTEDKGGNFSTPFLNTTHSLTPKEITITQ